ncbi:MAG: DUF4450 domain-containing protein, partial [Sphingobacteriales bacterium]
MLYRRILMTLLMCIGILARDRSHAQPTVWHDIQRKLHYRPHGSGFIKVDGNRRFNRALYGSNTGFRVETGDLPEFALYLPGMGGNLSFQLIRKGRVLPLINAKNIQTVYQPGSMIYTINDPILGGGKIELAVMALMEGEGIIIRTTTQHLPKDLKLGIRYGGASGKKFSRDGDIGADPESSFDFKPGNGAGNVYSISKNQFTLRFPVKKDIRQWFGIFQEQAVLTIAGTNT